MTTTRPEIGAGPADARAPRDGAPPKLSVVIATFNRVESLVQLLDQLARQTLRGEEFEVVVVDDGSAEPVAPRLRGLHLPFRLLALTQTNAGPAAARHRALLQASAELVVIVDDDMRIGTTFLADHVAAHPPGTRRVVLGPIRPSADGRLPLFERCHLYLLEKLEREVRAGERSLHGSNLYTGNVSFRRSDYFAVGGFDPEFRLSEDAELGLRLEAAGVEFRFADGAESRDASDHASFAGWRRRAVAYGAADARVAAKHPDVGAANPWRFLFLMNPAARPFLLLSVLAPALARPVLLAAMYLSIGLAAVGAERVAIAGMTVVYGMLYFSGVRAHAGSQSRAVGALVAYWRSQRGEPSAKSSSSSGQAPRLAEAGDRKLDD